MIGGMIGDTTPETPYPPMTSHFQMRSEEVCQECPEARSCADPRHGGCSGIGSCPPGFTPRSGTGGDSRFATLRSRLHRLHGLRGRG